MVAGVGEFDQRKFSERTFPEKFSESLLSPSTHYDCQSGSLPQDIQNLSGSNINSK
jgi:hypothetical protein